MLSHLFLSQTLSSSLALPLARFASEAALRISKDLKIKESSFFTQKRLRAIRFLSLSFFSSSHYSVSASETASSDGNGSAFDSTSTHALCAMYPLISRL